MDVHIDAVCFAAAHPIFFLRISPSNRATSKYLLRPFINTINVAMRLFCPTWCVIVAVLVSVHEWCIMR